MALGDIKLGNILIERKTLNDLAASITDGRYREQSYRLLKAKDEGFKIYYFIEGNMDLYIGRIPRETLISTMYSLTAKGFYVISTRHVKDTALYVMQFATKYDKQDTNATSNTSSVTTETSCDSYAESSVTKKKNSNITTDNISVYMLCQIPGISTQTAAILLDKYKHISFLIAAIQTEPMTTFTYEKDGKTRNMSKTVLDNLNRFLRVEPVP